MEKILFVSHRSKQCGVYQFGKRTIETLIDSKRYEFCYVEVSHVNGSFEFLKALHHTKPSAVIYNWHYLTMPWLTNDFLDHLGYSAAPNLKHLMIIHDNVAPPMTRINAFIHDDPYHLEQDKHFKVGRHIPFYTPKTTPPQNIIGSFGFGISHKGYTRVIEQVNKEFDQATVRLHIPSAPFVDPQGLHAKQVVEECRKLAHSGILLEVNHDFLSTMELLNWLENNTINCFFFDCNLGQGISSSIDYALAVKRPIAITDCTMFRHVKHANPSILIESSSLKQIIANGTKPLEPFYEAWTKENLISDYERIIGTVLNLHTKEQFQPFEAKYNLKSNRVLTVEDRTQLSPVIQELHRLSPDIMQTKFPEAVFQNAFIFQQVKKLAKKSDRIMVIGGYMDPIGPALQSLGFEVTISDPMIDGKDMDDVWMESMISNRLYDLVICCSVIEHVEDDITFIQQMYDILKPGGTALLTTDYRYDWTEQMPKPSSDRRLYTAERLDHLINHLPPESIIDIPHWDKIEPYFFIETASYCFCSLAFQKSNDVLSEEIFFLCPFIFEQYKNKNKTIITNLQSTLTQLSHEKTTLIDHVQDLEKNLAVFQKIRPSYFKIACKLQIIATKYPTFAKFNKKILKIVYAIWKKSLAFKPAS